MSSAKRFEENQNLSLHGTILPADIRDGEPVHCKLMFKIGDKTHITHPRVWKMSPLGIELLSDELHLLKGMPVDLELQIGIAKTDLTGLIVDETCEKDNHRFIFIRLVSNPVERVNSLNRRVSSRWLCCDQFFPTAVTPNPVKYNDFIFFKVKEISNGGFKLVSSLRNKFIVQGMIFDCIINFPMVSQFKIKIQVINVRVELDNGRESLVIGTRYFKEDKIVDEIIGQYLFQFGTAASLKEIFESGIHFKQIASAVNYSYVKTKEEYEEVLKLRLEAYKAAGKLKDGAVLTDMGDEFDARSRIVIGKYNNHVVCSARLIFNQFEDQMEQEKFVTWPEALPRKDEVVEIMRACTHPYFRGGDLLLGLFKFIAVTVAQSKRRWILICATPDMIPLYKKIGFYEVGLSYEHKNLNNKVHHVLIADFPKSIAGGNVSPIVWNIVWADTLKYLVNYGIMATDPLSNIRIIIYKFFSPIAKIIMRFKKIKPINNNWKQLK